MVRPRLARIAAEIIEAERHARHTRIHDEVDRSRRLVVGFGGVEDEAILALGVTLMGQREADAEGTVAMAVAVDGVGEPMRADREGLGELLAHQAARARQKLRQRVLDGVGVEAGEDVGHPLHTELDACHQRAHVAPALVGIARVAVEDLQHRLVGAPRLDQLRRRDDDALLEDVGGVGADRAWPQPPDIGEMRPAHHEGATPPLVEDGRDQHLVVRVRNGARRFVAVAIPVEVAGLHGVRREALEDRARHVAEDGHVGADRHHPISIEERGVEIFLLADEGRDGGTLYQRLHLCLRRADGATDDLQRHRIAGHLVVH